MAELPSAAAGDRAAPIAAGGARHRDRQTILVVDDEAGNLGAMRRRLTRHGYHVLQAADGNQALSLMGEHPVDLVLLDVMMPGMDGYAVLEHMRRRFGGRAPPVIMVTGRNGPQDVVAAIQGGAVDHIGKPFDANVLIARIQAHLRIAGDRNELRERAHALESDLEAASHRQRLDRQTGLPDLAALELALARCMVNARRAGESRYAGDLALRSVARIIQAEAEPDDCVARLRGDKFAVLKTCSTETARVWAERLLRTTAALTVQVGDDQLSLSLSVGITPLLPSDASPAAVRLRALRACDLAPGRGLAPVCILEADDDDGTRENMRWAMKVRKALQRDGFALFAQPIVAAAGRSRAPRRFEVLVRMIDEGDVIGPGRFLPAVERHGLSLDLDRWVVDRTIGELSGMPPGSLANLESVSINLSGYALGCAEFLEYVRERVMCSGVAPSLLCFEVTESVAASQPERLVAFMRSLQSLGVRFALDDFGAGVSSYGYLRTLPVDYLKIDGQFVRGIDSAPLNRAIVRSIHEVAMLLGIGTVAEFVENGRVAAELAGIGIDFLQGYHFGRPQPLAAWLGNV